MCSHEPQCPAIVEPEWHSATVVARHAELGWSMLCNGGILLDAGVRPAPDPIVALIADAAKKRRERARRAARWTPVSRPLAA